MAVAGRVALLCLVAGAALLVVDALASNPGPRHEAEQSSVGAGATEPSTVLVWASGGLADELAEQVAAQAEVATVVRGDRVDLTGSWDPDGAEVDALDPGWAIPLDGFAVDPATYAGFLPEAEAAAMRDLGPGEVVLGSTSARLRRADLGSVLEVEGVRLTVVAVVDDRHVGEAEIVVNHATGEQVGITRARFVLLQGPGDPDLEAAVKGLLPDDLPARVEHPLGDGPLRHGSAVLSQVRVKERFGEFSYRVTSGREFTQDPAWVRENIVTERVPTLGRITCHRDFMPLVRGALQELEEEGLGHLVRPREYEGCWTPRFSGARRSVSRHAWGIGIDFNAAANPYGAAPDQDPRLVAAMERWGMTWGGRWLVPDAMHFEYVGVAVGGAGASGR